ncbi:hypothetical protein Salat_0841900 [Sesamum alatum]|uniref:Uncharacterized protein n=1 Tax=Sesamum alatum TaxID=300844 RepID=A0AAE2CQJ0_9LAMI|nr:hypothetical protein Salat_0841900 [Sesamum alatum]
MVGDLSQMGSKLSLMEEEDDGIVMPLSAWDKGREGHPSATTSSGGEVGLDGYQNKEVCGLNIFENFATGGGLHRSPWAASLTALGELPGQRSYGGSMRSWQLLL